MQAHRMAIVLLHELFYRQKMRPVLEPKPLRQPHLFIERENFLCHPRVKMEQSPHAPEKFPCFHEREIIRPGENPSVGQLLNRGRLIPSHACPLQHVQVAQSAFAFFPIRLEQVDRLTKLLVLPASLLHLLRDKAIHTPAHDTPEIAMMEFLEELRTAGEKSRFHHAGLDRKIATGQLKTVRDGPQAVADLKAQI